MGPVLVYWKGICSRPDSANPKHWQRQWWVQQRRIWYLSDVLRLPPCTLSTTVDERCLSVWVFPYFRTLIPRVSPATFTTFLPRLFCSSIQGSYLAIALSHAYSIYSHLSRLIIPYCTCGMHCFGLRDRNASGPVVE
mgnify:CR=1 FL=1